MVQAPQVVMDNNSLEAELSNAIRRSKRSKISRLMMHPVKMLYPKFLKLTRKSGIVKCYTFFGREMEVIVPEVVSLSIWRYGFFEENLTKILLEHLRPGFVFIDIGAHFGYYSLLASVLVGDSGQVHSFEPTPSTFEILQRNTKNCKNIQINNLAVFAKRMTIEFNDYGVEFSAYNSIFQARLPEYHLGKLDVKKCKTKAIPLDEYVREKNIVPDFIKIDAESAEYEILLGAQESLSRFHPIISVEVGDMGTRDVRGSKELVLSIMDRGYDAYEFKEERLTKHDLRDRYGYDNLIFLPNTGRR